MIIKKTLVFFNKFELFGKKEIKLFSETSGFIRKFIKGIKIPIEKVSNKLEKNIKKRSINKFFFLFFLIILKIFFDFLNSNKSNFKFINLNLFSFFLLYNLFQ